MSLKSNLLSTPSRVRLHLQKQFLSTSPPLSAYSDTVSNLQVGQHTRVIFQGFTGRQVISSMIHSETPSEKDTRRLRMPGNLLSMGQRLSVALRLAETPSTLDFPCCRLCE